MKAGKTAYVDGVQLEQKAYMTTYADGSLGTGYSWSGTENNSNGVRSKADLSFPTAGNIDASEGTISLWFKPDWDGAGGNDRYILRQSASDPVSQIECFTYTFNQHFYCRIKDVLGANKQVDFGDISSWNSDSWHHLVFEWNPSNLIDGTNSLKGYLNSSNIGNFSGTFSTNEFTNNIQLGYGTTQLPNSTISDLRIYDAALTADEVADLYNQGLTTHSSDSESGKYEGPGTYYSGRIDMSSVSEWSATDDIALATALNGGTVEVSTCTKALIIEECIEDDYELLVGNEIQSDPNRYMFVKSVITGADAFTTPVLSGVTFNFVPDNTPPTNPTIITAYATNAKAVSYTDGEWGSSDRPYFAWPIADAEGGATDTGEGASGVSGYYVYFGTDDTADPETAGTYVADPGEREVTYQLAEGNELSTTGAHYLRIQTKDTAGSVQPTVWKAWTYQFDNGLPANPTQVSVTPAGWTKTNSFEFYWPAGADTDSGIWGYCYKTGEPGYEEVCTEESNVTGITAYQDGENVFYLRSKDTGGNLNESYVQTTYYYNSDAPSEPQNLTVTPTSSDTNAFEFDWDTPSDFNGEIAGYYYSINTEPTITNTTFTTESNLNSGAYATRQGENTFYVLAEDNAGNKNFEVYASVTFTANTSAPGIPTGLSISDSSDRANGRYSLTLEWNAAEGTVEHYNIYKSVDGETFSAVSTTTSAGYLDLDLDSDTTYYYKVGAEDNAGNEGGQSSVVSKKPTGQFATPPQVTEQPTVEIGSTTATISWKTDRVANSFVQIGTSEVYSRTQGQWVPVTEHSVEVRGLSPNTQHHYRVQSIDDPDLIDYETEESFSEDFTFVTGDLPRIKNLEVNDVRHTSAIITWETEVSSTSIVYVTDSLGNQTTVEDVATGGTTQHTVRIDSLTSGTMHTIRVSGTDSEGNVLIGEEHGFTTPAYPSISEVRLEQQKEAAVGTLKATWKTNVPTSSIAKYNKKGSANVTEVSKSDLVTEHELLLTGLEDNSEYEAVVSGRDSFGNEARSDVQTFTTDIDTRPPKVENVIVETGIIGTGSKARAQLVVSWDTDELATGQVEFDIGVGDIEGEVLYSQKTKEDSALTTSHVVVISDLQPSQVYHLRIATKDGADNISYSENNIVVTDEATENALELVMNSLLDTFGWLFGLE